ncbi:MAG: UDPGP type 1 family protein [Planctomycetota bacterium]|nr:MAG: UDPGP type 1 family protein [Planctomycetota bacterium]
MLKVRGERDQVNVAKMWEAGQSHVFRFWDTLDDAQRRALLDQIDEIDLQLLAELTARIGEAPALRPLAPPRDVIRLPAAGACPPDREAARVAGEHAIATGKVAGLIVAGGQGSRLGFERPKGCFPIGPVTGRSLLQIFFEQARAVAERHRSSFPLYVMTSRRNHEQVRTFLVENEWFGMSPVEVVLFEQRELPVVDERGRLLLAEPWRIATSPDGHGGVIRALAESGALEDMARRGIELISYWQVDNPLVPVADPVFLGYLLERGDEAGAKVATKRAPEERVGVWAEIEGRLGVVEYSELRPQDAEARDESGSLRYRWANLAIHAFRRSFLERMAADPRLPFHLARKRVPHIDREGRLQRPEQPNGIKFETFIFDAIAQADGVTLLEVERAREFAPVKNASGEDSPETARRALTELYGRWLEAAGLAVPRDAEGRVSVPIEISPLTALGPDDLEGKPVSEIEFGSPVVL